jgi:protein-tyrosine phosphatase
MDLSAPAPIVPAMAEHRLLFICLGNICRSPMAEGVFRHVAEQEGVIDRFEIDSAGLGHWHIGQAPDYRAQRAIAARGVDISAQCARQVRADDFRRFDLILAMDEENYRALRRQAPKDTRDKVKLFLDFAPHLDEQEVPDPFFGGAEGFDHALDLIEEAAHGLLSALLGNEAIVAPEERTQRRRG